MSNPTDRIEELADRLDEIMAEWHTGEDRCSSLCKSVCGVADDLRRLRGEVARLTDELDSEKRMHGVTKAFHDVAVADDTLHVHQRDVARAEVARLQSELVEMTRRRDVLASETVLVAWARAEVTAAKAAALAKAADEIKRQVNGHAQIYGAVDQRFRDGMMHSWAYLRGLHPVRAADTRAELGDS